VSISATGGMLAPPKPLGEWMRELERDRRRAKVECKGCGARYPALYAKNFDGHLRRCPKRPLDVALDNLRRMAEQPPAEYIVEHELAYVRKLVLS
jgi:hypothetical protein